MIQINSMICNQCYFGSDAIEHFSEGTAVVIPSSSLSLWERECLLHVSRDPCVLWEVIVTRLPVTVSQSVNDLHWSHALGRNGGEEEKDGG